MLTEPIRVRIALRELLGDYLLSRDQGDEVRTQVAGALERGEIAELDFAGVRSAIASFLNAAYGDLYGRFSVDTVDSLVVPLHASESIRASWADVRENAVRFYHDPEYRANLERSVDELFTQIVSQFCSVDRERPRRGDQFLVDANIWLYLTVSEFARARSEEVASYSQFFERCQRVGAELYYSAAILTEVANVIERNALKTSFGRSAVEQDKKAARKDLKARASVVSQIGSRFHEMRELGSYIDVPLGCDVDVLLSGLLAESRLDATDALHVLTYRSAKLNGIITDDGDFGSVPSNLVVFTANKSMLQC